MISLQKLINSTPDDVKQRSKDVVANVQGVTLSSRFSGGVKIATIVFTGVGRGAAEENWWDFSIELYPTEIHKNIFAKVGPENAAWVKCSCFTGDTLIPLADGKSVPIKDLVGLDEFFVYSRDTETGKLVIGRGSNCEIKEQNAELLEIEFDNGSKIKCTPDHEFLLRDGKTYIQAKDLIEGQSLSAMYRSLGSDRGMKDYEQVLQDDGYEFTHRLADLYNINHNIYKKEDGLVRHHKDFNKYNNSPKNIERLDWLAHYHKHHDHMAGDGNPMKNLKTVEKQIQTQRSLGQHAAASDRMKKENPMRKKGSLEKMLKTSKDRGIHSNERTMTLHKKRKEGWKNKVSETQKELIRKGQHTGTKILPLIVKRLKEEGRLYFDSEIHKKRSSQLALERLKKGTHPSQRVDFLSKLHSPESNNKRLRIKSIEAIKRHIMAHGSIVPDKFKPGTGYPSLKTITKNFNLNELVKEASNHKVVSVRKITEREDVYCFTVDQYENFVIDLDNGKPLSSGVVVHNCPFFHFYCKYAVAKKGSSTISNSDKVVYRDEDGQVQDTGATKPAFAKNPSSIAYLCKHLIKAQTAIVKRAQELAKKETRKGDLKFTG